jgi:hypothetical protein
MAIDHNGNVGIGTVDPDDTLHVTGGSGAVITGTISTSLASRVSIGGTPPDSNNYELGPGFLNLNRDDTVDAKQLQFGKNGTLHSGFETTTSGLEIFGSDGNPDLTITTSGNVGIGTTTTSGLLHVFASDLPSSPSPSTDGDDFIIEHATDAGMTIFSATTGTIYFGDVASATVGRIQYNHTSDLLTLRAGGAGGISHSKVNTQVTYDSGVKAWQVAGQIVSDLPSTISLSGASPTTTLDWSDGNFQVVDMSSATGTWTPTAPSNGIAGGVYGIKFIQNANNVGIDLDTTWGVLWPSGTGPTASSTNNAVDIITIFYDGSNWYGTFAQDFS